MIQDIAKIYLNTYKYIHYLQRIHTTQDTKKRNKEDLGNYQLLLNLNSSLHICFIVTLCVTLERYFVSKTGSGFNLVFSFL